MPSSNKELLRKVIRAYVQGDLAPLMASSTDDVMWDSNAPAGQYRFGGSFKGHMGLKEALSLVATEFAILRYDIHEMTGEGDVVWVLSDLEVVENKTGKRVRLELANRWQFRDGKIASCREFFDSAGVLARLGRLDGSAAAAHA
jgi:ketosteroid isomerase-like protein